MAEQFDVLHVIRPAAGGMKNHLYALVRGMDREGLRVLVAGPEPLASAFRQEGFPAVPVSIEPGPAIGRQLAAVWSLTGLARAHRVAVLHAHGGAAALVACPAARLAGVPAVVVTAHGSIRLGPPWRQRVSVAAQRGAMRLADRVIAVADYLRSELLALNLVKPERVVTIYNGIDAAAFGSQEDRVEVRRQLGLTEEQPVIGTIARLAPQKGVDCLLRAVALLRGSGHRVVPVIVGDGPLREELERLARDLDVPAVFLGYRCDVAELLAAFDLFVLPSLTEGLPLVILEALAAGCPVVASKVGGVPEAVDDGRTGWLVAPDEPAALARALSDALGDRRRAAAMAAAGQERIRRLFTQERMLTSTLFAYRQTLLDRGFEDLGVVFSPAGALE